MKKLPDIIAHRLKGKDFQSDTEALNFVKELIQEIALLGLSRAGLFNQAAFHGGTAFRILYGLDRFSEDLDFALKAPDAGFTLDSVIQPVLKECSAWGIDFEYSDRSKTTSTVRTAWLKEDSLGAMLELGDVFQPGQKIKVKIEIDTRPPKAAKFENKLCSFPTDFYVLCHDPTTMFAGKINAILTRSYMKGRDWYDFVEYLRLGVQPNLEFLKNSLAQTNYIAPQNDVISPEWLKDQLQQKIKQIDFNKMKTDVRAFISDTNKINLWSTDYFTEKVKTL